MFPIKWKWENDGWTGEGYRIELEFNEDSLEAQFKVSGIPINQYWDTLADAKNVCEVVELMKEKRCTPESSTTSENSKKKAGG